MNKSFGSHFLAVGSLTASVEPEVSPVPGRELVRATTLANGLQIVVWPVRNIPSVAMNNWVRAGSRIEIADFSRGTHCRDMAQQRSSDHVQGLS